MPNVGCLLGSAYQVQLALLSTALYESGLDITPAEYLVLRGLYSSDGMQQCDIAALLGKDKAAVSRCVATMQRKGLVNIENVSHKCRKAWLTDKGKAIEPKIMVIAKKRQDALYSLVDNEDMEAFVRVLKLIVNQ